MPFAQYASPSPCFLHWDAPPQAGQASLQAIHLTNWEEFAGFEMFWDVVFNVFASSWILLYHLAAR